MAAELSTREVYGRTLVALGRERPDLVVVDADLSPSTMTISFAREFPERFFDCGIAEQNMVGIAAGLAAAGKLVFASTFAIFATARTYDQLRLLVAHSRLNVKLVATHGGITVGEDGASHHAIEDLSLMCSLPGFTVVVPADGTETEAAVRAAAAAPGPFYIRLGRPKAPAVLPPGSPFQAGQAVVLREGDWAAILACGVMVSRALQAAEALGREGMECRVVNMSTLKPLDEAAVIAAAGTGVVVVAEEHLEHGGLGARVAQALARKRPVPVEFVSLGDRFAQSGKGEELLDHYGLSVQDIIGAVKRAVARKQGASYNSSRKSSSGEFRGG